MKSEILKKAKIQKKKVNFKGFTKWIYQVELSNHNYFGWICFLAEILPKKNSTHFITNAMLSAIPSDKLKLVTYSNNHFPTH